MARKAKIIGTVKDTSTFDLSEANNQIKLASVHGTTPYAVFTNEGWHYFNTTDLNFRLSEFTEDMGWKVLEVLNLKD